MSIVAIKGRDFKMYINRNGVPVQVCYATDCAINVNFGTIEISGPQSKWRDFISDYIDYSINIPALTVYTSGTYNYLDFLAAGIAGAKLTWEASAFDNGGVRHRGTILLTSLNQTSVNKDVIRFTVDAVGCGEIQTVLAPTNTVVYLSDFDKQILPGCPNPYPVSIFWYDRTLIGIATNPDDAISIFNTYSATNGGLYTLTSAAPGSCNFNMSVAFSAPKPYPTTIFAQQGIDFALSPDQDNNMALSPDQNIDNVLTPIGSA